jgi:magnesium transporter
MIRTLWIPNDGLARDVSSGDGVPNDKGWSWVDVDGDDSLTDLADLAINFGLDALAVSDAGGGDNGTRFVDFGDQLLLNINGFSMASSSTIETYEMSMFLTRSGLVTIRSGPSSTVDRMWEELQDRIELGDGGPDELMARLCYVVTQRWATVLDGLEEQLDGLIDEALEAAPDVLESITDLRGELRTMTRSVRPQTVVLNDLALSESQLIARSGRRRFSDSANLSRHVEHDIETGRAALGHALDAYHGAEARKATEIGRVLTVYAAVMLPLSLVAGFFGMNVVIPGESNQNAWVWIVLAMAVITLLSLGIFIAVGVITLPSRRRPTRSILEHARRPLQLGRSFYGSITPKRSIDDS